MTDFLGFTAILYAAIPFIFLPTLIFPTLDYIKFANKPIKINEVAIIVISSLLACILVTFWFAPYIVSYFLSRKNAPKFKSHTFIITGLFITIAFYIVIVLGTFLQ